MNVPFENDTRAVVKKLAGRSFRANRMRNVIAAVAIALTGILFTSLFTLGSGLKESAWRANMILSGGDGHARITGLSESEYARIGAHPRVREIGCSRKLADSVDNAALSKRNTLFVYCDGTARRYLSVEPSAGRAPVEENEVIMDTETLERLGVPKERGAEVMLELTVGGRSVARGFVLSGWWDSFPGVDYGTIVASAAYVRAHADELNDACASGRGDTGTITGILKFADARNLAEDLDAVVRESGYSDDFSAENYVNAGISPLYASMETSNHAGTALALGCALALFLASGYLIVYNIFQISILRDLHFYGMLKTIGATGRQIGLVVRGQAWRLCAAGIPAGLCCGFLIGKRLLPALMAHSDLSGAAAAVSPNPLIFIAAAAFTLLTVFSGARKPAKMAAKVSPIEAMRYADSDAPSGGRRKRRACGGKPQWKMAWANLGRNRRRTALVVLSLCVSALLANTVFTFSHSVDPRKATLNRLDSDFRIGQSRLFDRCELGAESALDERFIRAVRARAEFEDGGAEYGCRAVYRSEGTAQSVNRREDGAFSTHLYGLDAFPYARLRLVDGEMDAEKLASGGYILEGAFVNTRGVLDAESLNHRVGDKLELEYAGRVREFTVLGHVVANEANTYDWVGSCFFLPGGAYREFTGDARAMSYKFDVTDGAEADMERFLKAYTDSVEPEATYVSQGTVMAGVEDIRSAVVLIGGTLALIIGVIGVLNFANAMLTSIFTRRRELAILQSAGMTAGQIRKMLCLEGCGYAAVSLAASAPLCALTALALVRPICEKVWFLNFRMNLRPLCAVFLALFSLGILIPCAACRVLNRQSVVERLRCGE